MRLEALLAYFSTSPALHLLRSSNAPFIVEFLERQFKQRGRITIPQSDLLGELIEYRETIRESYSEALPSTADVYLSQWCTGDSLWLRRSFETGRDEPVYQLTPHTEDVFAFLDRVLARDVGFVGTESRLKLVIDTLADLVVGSSDDPQSRLAHLKDESLRIQEEITRIEADGRVTKYQPAQIRERFGTAVSLLRQLQGDFRAVEESFRNITLQVQQRQAQGRDSRGGILEFALDAEDYLKEVDQGVSFYEFVKLILSPSQTERLQRVIHEVRQIPDLLQQQDGLDTVRGMVTLLQNEADRVMRTNQRLTATLRRLLDTRAHEQRERIAQVLRDIRLDAIALADNPPSDDVGLVLELDMEIQSPFRRTFWSASPSLEAQLSVHTVDDDVRREVFLRLASMQRLNWKEMRSRINTLVDEHGTRTLAELLQTYPPKAGVIEVLGYLQIACDEKHIVDRGTSEIVVVPPARKSDRALRFEFPLVKFTHRGGR